MSMPDEIWVTPKRPATPTQGTWGQFDQNNDVKYHSDSKYKALEARIEAAEKLCEVYFYIASQVIGEDEVRKKVNARIDK